MEHQHTVPVSTSDSIDSTKYDAIVLILDSVSSLNDVQGLSRLISYVDDYSNAVADLKTGVHLIICEFLSSKRLILSFTGPLDRDFDDIRRVTEAAKEGVLHAVKIGATKPLVALVPLKFSDKLKPQWSNENALCLSVLLSALSVAYVPLECREFSERPACKNPKSVKPLKVDEIGWFTGAYRGVDHFHMAHVAWALEEGRRVARDIGGSDPERMCASRIVSYIVGELTASGVVTATEEPVDAKLYPLAAAVDRGSSEHHRGSIVHLEYASSVRQSHDSNDVTDLFMIGKGIVYDTGGHDLKVNGGMANMHRDKCGAAAVAGFFKTLSILQPAKLNVHGSLAIIRNSIGENAYVSDEIITSRAGIRVRVTNTDAEGRMVMADLLCEAKERALNTKNPQLITAATLTGHVILSYGPNYTGIVCNGPARHEKKDKAFQDAGAMLGEMNEISTLRREDFEVMAAQEEYADLRNSARLTAGVRARGHQSPVAFMINAAGLDSHMLNSDRPLPYTHFDNAGSQGPCPGIPSAVPLLTWASHYLLSEFW